MIYSAVICSVIVALLGGGAGAAGIVGWRQKDAGKVENRETLIVMTLGGAFFALGLWATVAQAIA